MNRILVKMYGLFCRKMYLDLLRSVKEEHRFVVKTGYFNYRHGLTLADKFPLLKKPVTSFTLDEANGTEAPNSVKNN